MHLFCPSFRMLGGCFQVYLFRIFLCATKLCHLCAILLLLRLSSTSSGGSIPGMIPLSSASFSGNFFCPWSSCKSYELTSPSSITTFSYERTAILLDSLFFDAFFFCLFLQPFSSSLSSSASFSCTTKPSVLRKSLHLMLFHIRLPFVIGRFLRSSLD